MRQFSMSLTGGVRVISAVAVLIMLGIPLLVWGALPGVWVAPGSQAARWATLLGPGVVLLVWALAPKGLEIEGGELRILRRAWRAAAFPLAAVGQVEALPRDALRFAVRTFGVGGLFGYYGWFYKKGAFRLYATRTDRLVELVIGGKRVVVSPDEPGRFIDGLLASAPRAVRRQPGVPGAASASARS